MQVLYEELYTFECVHKFFHIFWSRRCVAWRHHLFGRFWSLTRIRKLRSERSFHSLSLYSLAHTHPHVLAEASHRKPLGCSHGTDPQRDQQTEQLKSTYNRQARDDVHSSLSPTLTGHGQKHLNGTPRYNTPSVKDPRYEWPTIVLRIYNSRLPSMRFSHFWQLFNFSLAPNGLNTNFFVHYITHRPCGYSTKKKEAEYAGGSSSTCIFFRNRAFFGSGFWHCICKILYQHSS
jgi:hypothetical protein